MYHLWIQVLTQNHLIFFLKQVLTATRELVPGFSDLSSALPCQGGYLHYSVYTVYRYLYAAIVLDIDDSDSNIAGRG